MTLKEVTCILRRIRNVFNKIAQTGKGMTAALEVEGQEQVLSSVLQDTVWLMHGLWKPGLQNLRGNSHYLKPPKIVVCSQQLGGLVQHAVANDA